MGKDSRSGETSHRKTRRGRLTGRLGRLSGSAFGCGEGQGIKSLRTRGLDFESKEGEEGIGKAMCASKDGGRRGNSPS